ncbi:RNA-binding protein 25 [Marchantia polymorpha subsp. ruderalis]|uniref:RRM domain-containing protein n=2 Tax=Marchantia polymorpha TaxID=3197 RepID=A0AAF6BAN4_MARPO|nr:hypothetical protein MARPO_0148s0032 [Marchantia polymorpha]BBN09068.1 hypothetical protein Mp_4g16880 [Marchantia polymorpha subsp. ruderalis]|eukprot:PTQ29083.1 hypothetical protein MARPO_0148s0032 [Marchantia polymorpha]
MNPPFVSMPPGQSVPPPPPGGQPLPVTSHPSTSVPGPGPGNPSLLQPAVAPPIPAAGPAPLGSAPGAASGVPSSAPGVRVPPGPQPPPAPPTSFPAIRPYNPAPMMPNYMTHPVPQQQQQQQMLPPGGMPNRFPAPPYNSMARPPAFVPRPPLGPPPPVTMSTMTLPRPPGNGLRPVAPVLKPPLGMTLAELAAKGIGQLAAPPEKPHTTVYVGKIASTIEDEFLRALLELCGVIKSWKRAQDPTTGSPKGFGFCEFESAEGVLRALRLLNKFSLDGQELVLNVNQATRDYLERYVSKKKESEKLIREEAEAIVKDEELAPGVESIETSKPSLILFPKDEGTDKEENAEEDGKKFGLVNDFDRQADELASQKLASMLEERARLRPLPPPPPLPPAGSLSKAASPFDSSRFKDGDSNLDGTKSEDLSSKNEDDAASDHKASVDIERTETTSADKGRRSERDRERDRERELEREKERELERYERERERERSRREREREMRVREAERIYEEREREWEGREREKERQRLHDREREKDRERDRRKEIKEQEEESDDDEWKKSRYRVSLLDEKRKRRLREREEDTADREREEQEMLAKRQKLEMIVLEKEPVDGEGDYEMAVDEEVNESPSPQVFPSKDTVSVASASDAEDDQPRAEALNSNGIHELAQNAEGSSAAVTSTEADLKASPAPRKLGFGIMGSGKRTTVTSVFHQEDEEEKTEDRRLRPLVPIDYSAEEMEAVAVSTPATVSSPAVASNLAAAAEFAKSLSNLSSINTSTKENKKEDGDRDRSRRKRDRPAERETPRKEKNRDRDRDRERDREREDRERDRDWEREKKDLDKEREKERVEKTKVPEVKKILNAKQLIDTIPKTKEELFAYPVDWLIYDRHDLHERMRPWISKKITEFLGEEETTLVDFIVSNTCKHVTAASMLELLESILDDEAEMFVLKMWRMLIFEIRRVETGLATSKSKS